MSRNRWALRWAPRRADFLFSADHSWVLFPPDGLAGTDGDPFARMYRSLEWDTSTRTFRQGYAFGAGHTAYTACVWAMRDPAEFIRLWLLEGGR